VKRSFPPTLPRTARGTMECGSAASPDAEADASALQTGQRAAPSLPQRGRGAGGEGRKWAHPAHSEPKRCTLIRRGQEGEGENAQLGILPICPATPFTTATILEVMRKYLPDECIDLVYLDPPFNSNRDYNLLFREQSGEPSAGANQSLHRHLAVERARLRRVLSDLPARAGGIGTRLCAHAGAERPDGVLGDDGAALGEVASGAEADGEFVFALRLSRVIVSKSDVGCGLWGKKLPQRDSMETHQRPCQCRQKVRSDYRYYFVLY
jgi:hypothetical protein